MKKKLYLIIFSIFIFFILYNSTEIMESIKLSFSICINNLFPSLIPFMLLSNILINYDFVNDISDIFKSIMTKIFKVNKNCAFALMMSIISGTPSNAKYLKDLLDKNLISTNDCQKCLNFCHFTNPIFILGTIGYTFLKDKRLGLIILISHYTSSILIGLFNKNNINDNFDNFKLDKSNKSFISILTSSINSVIDTLLLIMGIITTSLILSCILNNIFNLNNNLKFLYGIIEVTQGLKYISLSTFSIKIKAILSTFLISFGGICIHAQVFSILENKKIRYLPYFISRISHAIISSSITLLIINFVY